MSLKPHSNASQKIGGLKNELCHLCPLNRIQIFQNFIAIPWKWTTEGFKTDCGQNLWIEISFFNIFWQNLFKKCSKNSLRCLENDPLNVLTLVVGRIRNMFLKNIKLFSTYAQFEHFNMLQKQLFWFTNYKRYIFFILLFLFVPPFLSPRCVSPGRWSQCNESGWAFCANSHSFAKIRLQMPTLMAQLPHISRHPSMNQPT